MPPLKLHDTLPMYLCCGRAFLSEESYTKHRELVTTHGKPIDLTKIRNALHENRSKETLEKVKGLSSAKGGGRSSTTTVNNNAASVSQIG
jgi:hypothetical protein